MDIKIVIDARLLGGVEIHVLNLCEELIKRGHHCSIIFIRHYPNNILYTLCDKRALTYQVCHSYKELYDVLAKGSTDIIHTHGYKANFLGRLIGLVKRIPVVSTFHSGEKPTGRLILYNALDRWSSFMSYNISVNSVIASKLPFKSIVLPNFVTIPKSLTPLKNHGPYNIYFIGRFSPEKGPSRFGELSQQAIENVSWHMVGTGPLLEQCLEQFSDTVQFHGQVADMNTIWPDVDLLCITSTYEGLPLVLLEAMSRGIPVVSFDVGSIKEIQTQVEYVIKPYDMMSMKECITNHFLKRIDERQLMADTARRSISSTFSTEAVVSDIEACYQRWMK